MPKFPPPPRTPQKRSGCSVALAVRHPSAVTRSEVIGRQAVGTGEPAITAPQGEPRDARRGDVAQRGGQPERLRLAVELAPVRPGWAWAMRCTGSTRRPSSARGRS